MTGDFGCKRFKGKFWRGFWYSSLSLCFAHILGNTPKHVKAVCSLLAACACHFQLEVIFLMRKSMRLYWKYAILKIKNNFVAHF